MQIKDVTRTTSSESKKREENKKLQYNIYIIIMSPFYLLPRMPQRTKSVCMYLGIQQAYLAVIYTYNYCGGQRLELLYWALSPIYKQKCVPRGANVWKSPIMDGRVRKKLKAIVREGPPPRT